jgi:hypothetical protein
VTNAELAFRMELLEHNMEKVLLYLEAMSEKQGIVPSSIPGMDKPPPVRHSLSPSLHSASASSPQLGMSSLNISDSRSNASSISDPGKQKLHNYIIIYSFSQLLLARGSRSDSAKGSASKRGKGADAGTSRASSGGRV